MKQDIQRPKWESMKLVLMSKRDMNNRRISRTIWATIVTLLYQTLVVNTQTCETTHCNYDASQMDPNVTCTLALYGNADGNCYPQWSSFSGCSCDTNYRISSTGVTYWCYGSDVWSPDIYSLECYAPCTPDAEEPAIADDDTVFDGETVEYSCPDGYTQSGTSQVACNDGQWSDHTIFKCLAPCNFPNSSKPVDEAFTEPVPHGTSVGFTCIEGYIPTGTRVTQCKDGTFDPDVVCTVEQCADDQCEFDEELLDDRLTYGTPTRHGNTAPPTYCYGLWSSFDSFACEGAKWVVRPVTTTTYCVEDDASNVDWENNIYNLTCHEPCPVLSGLPSDVVAKDHDGVSATLFEHEEYVTYECTEPTDTLLGVTTATCEDGKWDNETIPNCLDACYFPPNARSTRNKMEPITHGDTVILQCDDGYVPRDTVTSQCNDGTLTPYLTCNESV